MEVIIAVRSGMLLRALRVLLKRGVSAPTEEGTITMSLRQSRRRVAHPRAIALCFFTLELELIQTQMAQKPMLRAEVGMRVRCANKASAE